MQFDKEISATLSVASCPVDAATLRAYARVCDLDELRIGRAALACRSRAPRRGPACGSQTGFRRTLAASHIRAKRSAQGIPPVRSRSLCMAPHLHPDLYHPFLRVLGRVVLAMMSAFVR